ncbi:MAG: RHS repeat protein [Deltaproteobacteria bacterium]|nr:RHS repeat protein [Deltaproteobacteria bacterium]
MTTTTMTWNASGTLASLTDTEGRQRTFTWDNIERLMSVLAPDGRQEIYDYRLRDARGDIVSDATGLEPTRVTLTNSDTVTRSYDGQHRLIRAAVGPTDVVRYRYNQMGTGGFDLVQKLRGDDNNDVVTRWTAAIATPPTAGTRQGPVVPLFQPRPTLRVRVASNEASSWTRDAIGRVVTASDGFSFWSSFYNPDGTLARVCDGSSCGRGPPWRGRNPAMSRRLAIHLWRLI